MTEAPALNALLREFGRSTGTSALQLNDDGVCALSFDDRVVLHIAAGDGPDGALLYVKLVDEIPERERPGTYQKMLEANLLGDTLAGGALALDPRNGAAVLIYRARIAGLGYPEFERLIEELVHAAESWIALLSAPMAREEAEIESGVERWTVIGDAMRV